MPQLDGAAHRTAAQDALHASTGLDIRCLLTLSLAPDCTLARYGFDGYQRIRQRSRDIVEPIAAGIERL